MSTLGRGAGEPYEGSPSIVPDLGDRNRLVRRILLAVVAVLIIASFLVGIRW